MLGGLIGIAVAQAILNRQLLESLGSTIRPEKLAALLRSATAVLDFTPEEAAMAKACYGSAFNLQNRVLMGFSVAALVASFGSWKRHPEEFAEVDKRRSQTQNCSAQS